MNEFNFYPVRLSGTAAGTTVCITARSGIFQRVVVGGNYTGTATFYDSATAAGTTATNYICSFNNNSGSVPMNVEVGCRVKDGLVAVLGGTTEMTAIVG